MPQTRIYSPNKSVAASTSMIHVLIWLSFGQQAAQGTCWVKIALLQNSRHLGSQCVSIQGLWHVSSRIQSQSLRKVRLKCQRQPVQPIKPFNQSTSSLRFSRVSLRASVVQKWLPFVLCQLKTFEVPTSRSETVKRRRCKVKVTEPILCRWALTPWANLCGGHVSNLSSPENCWRRSIDGGQGFAQAMEGIGRKGRLPKKQLPWKCEERETPKRGGVRGQISHAKSSSLKLFSSPASWRELCWRSLRWEGVLLLKLLYIYIPNYSYSVTSRPTLLT